ncbi:MAG: alpha-xylosidase, partial [Bacteroidota bacterium]
MNRLLNQPLDISEEFKDFTNEFFVPDKLTSIDASGRKGSMRWNKHMYQLEWAFNKIGRRMMKSEGKEIPSEDYVVDPVLDWSIAFHSSRVLRLRLSTSCRVRKDDDLPMLTETPLPEVEWEPALEKGSISFSSEHGSLTLAKDIWGIEVKDANDRSLFKTLGLNEYNSLHQKYIPFSFMRRSSDYKRMFAASFTLKHDEKIFGCGESFTRLDKRGQKIPLFTTDAQSAGTKEMYKPIPFFISSRGYGMFVHSGAPMTFDFGNEYDGSNTLYLGDDQLDLFIFIGTPEEILSEYTLLTGRSPVPPLWSFGLWMSRLGYDSREAVEEVADKMEEYSIPLDVIHIDARWFSDGYNCDYTFSDQFPDPEGMISGLKERGIHTSLWQLPYYTTRNSMFDKVVDKKLHIRDGSHGIPTEDVILDFTNPQTLQWYEEKINPLLDMGVSAIKADFGEGAPVNGLFHSGRTGFYEHNLYPLYYTQKLFDLVKRKSEDTIIWARSSWAGGQRYPVHWGGDPEVSDFAMASTLRAGLSLGLSGFTYWSHDIGGFSSPPEPDLFLRWAFFGLFSSHSRVHGLPPKEPWHLGEEVVSVFRKMVEIRYRLIPFLYTQAVLSSRRGLPMIRPIFM